MTKNLIIYGYNCNNLGDDLMFAEIINKTNYENYFFIGTANVPHFINKKISFIKMGRLMPLRWKFKSDFAVIGGSVLMGGNEAQESMILRKQRWFKLNKLFFGRNFIIGANLGPFKQKSCYLKLLSQLNTCTDKWFVRDGFSKALLDEIDAKSRYLMPDIVMGYDVSNYDMTSDNSVSISVTEVDKDGGGELSSDIYEREIASVVNHYVEKGYNIKFLSFEDSKDIDVIERIKRSLDNKVQERTITIRNCQNDVISAIAKSEVLVSTRFHAMVLGALFGKKQIIYSYSGKTTQFAQTYNFQTQTITGCVQGKEARMTGFTEQQISEVKDYAELVEQ